MLMTLEDLRCRLCFGKDWSFCWRTDTMLCRGFMVLLNDLFHCSMDDFRSHFRLSRETFQTLLEQSVNLGRDFSSHRSHSWRQTSAQDGSTLSHHPVRAWKSWGNWSNQLQINLGNQNLQCGWLWGDPVVHRTRVLCTKIFSQKERKLSVWWEVLKQLWACQVCWAQ